MENVTFWHFRIPQTCQMKVHRWEFETSTTSIKQMIMEALIWPYLVPSSNSVDLKNVDFPFWRTDRSTYIHPFKNLIFTSFCFTTNSLIFLLMLSLLVKLSFSSCFFFFKVSTELSNISWNFSAAPTTSPFYFLFFYY